MSFSCECFVLSTVSATGRSLEQRSLLPSLVLLSVNVKPRQPEGFGPLRMSSHGKKALQKTCFCHYKEQLIITLYGKRLFFSARPKENMNILYRRMLDIVRNV
jgi:hypothetical protein